MPVLYLLVGIPGAGKTTWAMAHPNLCYVGSDAVRQELYGKELTLRGHAKVHGIMMQRALAYLKSGQDVVLDSAHLSKYSRRLVLKQLPGYVRRVAVFLDTPLRQALFNNAHRDRHVPEIGIGLLRLRLSKPTYEEGFDEILVHRVCQGGD